MKSKELNSKKAIDKIKELDTVVSITEFISEDEDRKTVLKAAEDRKTEIGTEEPLGVTIESVIPKKQEEQKPVSRGRVRFISNGSNIKLGTEGTVKHPAEATARLFVDNGWGVIE